jgi:hypothetical protein
VVTIPLELFSQVDLLNVIVQVNNISATYIQTLIMPKKNEDIIDKIRKFWNETGPHKPLITNCYSKVVFFTRGPMASNIGPGKGV